MLIRLVINNVLSFGAEREFNMFPYPHLSNRLSHHKYEIDKDFSLLKMAAIYGANGSGKSNFVKALSFLKEIVVNGQVPNDLANAPFLLQDAPFEQPQTIGIEFMAEGQSFWYAVETINGIIKIEELYETNFGKGEPKQIFERKGREGEANIHFGNGIEEKVKYILNDYFSLVTASKKSIITNPIAFTFLELKKVFNWFKNLEIITPSKKADNLIYLLAQDKEFNRFANGLIKTFNTGIQKIVVETKSIEAYFGANEALNIREVSRDLKNNKADFLPLNNSQDFAIAIEEEGKVVVKRLLFQHQLKDGTSTNFHLYQLSDGTKRLLDYLVMLSQVILNPSVVVIDEIARSIHPALLKTIIEKFSMTENTKGQLIFTTHEANLLDQEILRPDEIWFMEKDKFGCSDMYPLSEFKEHKTKDIRKGYLNGRYGAIPFLGALKNLNWNDYGAAQ
jgi:AAA15 family ATPase/GTPase